MKAGKIALIAVVSVLVLIGGVVLWINAAATRRFAEMERDVKALHEEVLRRGYSRPPRPGTTLPGNAWDDYQKAMDAVQADLKALGDLDHFLQRSEKADAAKARERVAAHAATLDLLRSGVRRAQNIPPLQWEQGGEMKLPSFTPAIRLANLAAARARFLAEEGKHREAADLALDACQLARDLGTNSVLICSIISMSLLTTEFEELRALVASGALSKEDLVDIDRALMELDRGFPRTGHIFVNESLLMGYTLLRSANLSVLQASLMDVTTLGLWRYGFSTRLTFAAAFEELHSLMKRMESLDDLTWNNAGNLAASVGADAQKSKNPLVLMMVPGLMKTAQVNRERRAQLRLLQAAARWRATGQAPDVADPFGDKLLHDEKDGIFRVWSIGPDGIDQGGIGEWKVIAGKDIVLQWKR